MRKDSVFSRKSISVYITGLILFSFLLLLYIWEGTIAVEKNFQYKNCQKENLELQKRLSQLEIKYNKESSVSNIEKIAKERLQMVYPEKIQFIVRPPK
ncbi:MAG: FtsL-like putative cell division protein [Candidatus Wallbacteria bacterium]|nr:FtsL-like putative cell division protein [Candidatus Wallbacteria bacterium]